MPALLTAGIIMIAVGLMLATFPAGFALGVAVAIAGTVLFAVVAIRCWSAWKRRPKRASTEKDPDRFWNAEHRLGSLAGAAAGVSIGWGVLAFLRPEEDRDGTIFISAPILVASLIAYLLMRGHNKRKRAAGDHRIGSETD
ncbi:hypothetical protein QL996_13420 [Planococcus sp. APC 4015]|nr:hypothetical protein [Planococcus sp. APC 4015]